METVTCAQCGTELLLPIETLLDIEEENRMYDISNMGFLCKGCEEKLEA